MTVYETDLPGVGRRFDIELSTGEVVSMMDEIGTASERTKGETDNIAAAAYG
jgi:hypothetical protein